ncbi:hypothetical protein PoB_001920600 [Plakobranchus ocellatus]|uniref:Uncharacterized protein n=1 Tax=Plakobranchus ocellatus TaxID=259542 RepID=A0AAV3Z9U1_9GAST|nr:hypothetical protein PoB_001920600 [Plakobranchus ocellatus]
MILSRDVDLPDYFLEVILDVWTAIEEVDDMGWSQSNDFCDRFATESLSLLPLLLSMMPEIKNDPSLPFSQVKERASRRFGAKDRQSLLEEPACARVIIRSHTKPYLSNCVVGADIRNTTTKSRLRSRCEAGNKPADFVTHSSVLMLWTNLPDYFLEVVLDLWTAIEEVDDMGWSQSNDFCDRFATESSSLLPLLLSMMPEIKNDPSLPFSPVKERASRTLVAKDRQSLLEEPACARSLILQDDGGTYLLILQYPRAPGKCVPKEIPSARGVSR